MRIELISLVSQTNTLPLSYSRQTRVGIEPTLLFKHIEIPNEQFASFQWKNEKKKGRETIKIM